MTDENRIPAKTLSFTIGLLSLGAETLWVRTATFFGESTPKAFALILGVYLIGIACGAMLGARLCAQGNKLSSILVACLLGGAITILASPFILASGTTLAWAIGYRPGIYLPPLMIAGLAFLTAFIFSIGFPICHHIGTTAMTGQIGKSMSRVYCANIAGSVLGPLAVNFGLLQFATTQFAFALLGLGGIAAAAALLALVGGDRRLRMACALCVGLAVTAVVVSAATRNWLVASLSGPRTAIRHIVETRQGIVVAFKDDEKGDMIYGGNVYDGRTNLDPRINSNGINRILVLGALKPDTKRVLVIGLSVGTWLALLNGFPGVEAIDVVEINPGYLDLIKFYPPHQAALADPRVKVHIGDGRKFLRSVPSGSYDLVLMNTTWHWRAYASLLLSREFLTMARKIVAPGGLIAFNSTHSPDAFYTASTICPHAYLYDNFVICGDFDWRQALETPEAADRMMRFKLSGRPLFAGTGQDLVRDFISRKRTTDLAVTAAAAKRPLEVITDRNLITEYKYGR